MKEGNPNINFPPREEGAINEIVIGLSGATAAALLLLPLPEPFLKGIAIAAIVGGIGLAADGFRKLGYNRALSETEKLNGITPQIHRRDRVS